jgi:hypothetical protein
MLSCCFDSTMQSQWELAALLMLMGIAAGIDSVYFSASSSVPLRALVLMFGVLSFVLGVSFGRTAR